MIPICIAQRRIGVLVALLLKSCIYSLLLICSFSWANQGPLYLDPMCNPMSVCMYW